VVTVQGCGALRGGQVADVDQQEVGADAYRPGQGERADPGFDQEQAAQT